MSKLKSIFKHSLKILTLYMQYFVEIHNLNEKSSTKGYLYKKKHSKKTICKLFVSTHLFLSLI